MNEEQWGKVLRAQREDAMRKLRPRLMSLRLRRTRRRLGFGGSVTALRLTEKGYRVGVLEAGARFEDKDFADDSGT